MMGQDNVFPKYIQRKREEGFIRGAASKVHRDGQSRVILFYGEGGAGKTSILHHLDDGPHQSNIIWLDPIDSDDSEYWVLPNLERKIAEDLNIVEGAYF